jgi:transposase
MFSWRRGQAYSRDLRERVFAADHLSARRAADRFGVSVSYVVKARQRREQSRSVFLDERWTKTNMNRLHGWGPRGQRVFGRVPHGHWRTTTFLAGLRHDRIAALLMLDGAIDGATFLAWVEQSLALTLQKGDIVVADNLACHKVAGVRKAIEARGASLLCLPAYSPDLNLSEQLFFELKASVRSLAPRTWEALKDAIRTTIDRVSPTECANDLAHAGYGQSA